MAVRVSQVEVQWLLSGLGLFFGVRRRHPWTRLTLLTNVRVVLREGSRPAEGGGRRRGSIFAFVLQTLLDQHLLEFSHADQSTGGAFF